QIDCVRRPRVLRFAVRGLAPGFRHLARITTARRQARQGRLRSAIMIDSGDWVLISLDERLARRQGVPTRDPVPRAEFEGLATGGLGIDAMRRWSGQFIASAPKDTASRTENGALLTSLEAFIGKSELWAKAQQAFAANDYKRAISTL